AAFRIEVSLPTPVMRLRFEMLRQINMKISSVLPFLNLRGDGCIAQQLAACRGLLFHATKMHFFYDILDKTSVQVPQPTVTIDRLKLAARKEDRDSKDLFNTEEGLLKHTAFGIAH